MNSIRRRLLLGTAAATIVIFLAAAVALYVLARKSLIAEFDSGLRARIQSIMTMTEFDVAENRVEVDTEDLLKIPEFRGTVNPEYFEVESGDRGDVELSPTLGGKRLDRTGLAGQGPRVVGFIQLPDGRRGRAMTMRAKTQPDEQAPGASGPQISITVAKSTAQLDWMLGQLRLLLGVVCGIATLALLGLTGWIIHSGMRPLVRVARGIGGIGAADLGERLEFADAPKELVPIVARLNDLLARLHGAFEREKSFTADAAHELRTPLAGLEAALEVCATQKRDVPQYERVVGDCLRVTQRMHAMVDNLLLLARADADRVPVAREPVSVGLLLRESWARFEPIAIERGLQVEMDVEDDLVAQTDEAKLAIIFNNVLENAVHYANEGGRVGIWARADGGVARVSVANTGSRVDAGDAERVFDRFWRGDRARGSAGRNCGLGLAVCRKLATALGASLDVTTERGGLFVANLELIGARSSSSAAPRALTAAARSDRQAETSVHPDR